MIRTRHGPDLRGQIAELHGAEPVCGSAGLPFNAEWKNRPQRPFPHPRGTIEPIANDAAEALMNPVQRRVADIWRKILGCNRVSLHDNFFDIGGHSMLIVKLHGDVKAGV